MSRTQQATKVKKFVGFLWNCFVAEIQHFLRRTAVRTGGHFCTHVRYTYEHAGYARSIIASRAPFTYVNAHATSSTSWVLSAQTERGIRLTVNGEAPLAWRCNNLDSKLTLQWPRKSAPLRGRVICGMRGISATAEHAHTGSYAPRVCTLVLFIGTGKHCSQMLSLPQCFVVFEYHNQIACIFAPRPKHPSTRHWVCPTTMKLSWMFSWSPPPSKVASQWQSDFCSALRSYPRVELQVFFRVVMELGYNTVGPWAISPNW